MSRGTDLTFPAGVAVVTGAARGIGAAVASALVARGVDVAAFDADGDTLARATEDCPAAPGRIHPFTVDVADASAVRAAVERVETTVGPIGMLANVAGVLRLAAATSLTDDDWAHCFAVNTHGVFHLSRAVAARMIARRTGSIVTVGSNAALVPRTQMAAYAASKAAAHQFSRCLGLELAGHGIRCNIVAPARPTRRCSVSCGGIRKAPQASSRVRSKPIGRAFRSAASPCRTTSPAPCCSCCPTPRAT